MESIFNELTQIRKQLVIQQSSINECLSAIDALIISQINAHPTSNTKVPNGYIKITKLSGTKEFPTDINSKRDKLKYILSEASEPMTAREIKMKLLEYGEFPLHVDQSLVNLEKDGLIFSTNEEGRKRYFIQK